MEEYGRAEEEANSLLSRDSHTGLHPRPCDHDLSQRQTLNLMSHLGTSVLCLKMNIIYIISSILILVAHILC